MFFQFTHNVGDRRLLLADSHINTLNARAFLVDDRVDRDSCFTYLAVTDNQFALAAADWHHGVDCFQTGLYWLGHGLTRDNTRRNFFDGIHQFGIDRTLAIDWHTQCVNYAAFELRPDGNLQD